MFADTTQRDIRSESGTTPIFACDSTSMYDVCTAKIQPFFKFAKRFQKKVAFHTQNALNNSLALNVS